MVKLPGFKVVAILEVKSRDGKTTRSLKMNLECWARLSIEGYAAKITDEKYYLEFSSRAKGWLKAYAPAPVIPDEYLDVRAGGSDLAWSAIVSSLTKTKLRR